MDDCGRGERGPTALDASAALDALSDPARAALLLVRACAAVAPRAAEPSAEPRTSAVETEANTAEHDRNGSTDGALDDSSSGDAVAGSDSATTNGDDNDEDDDAERLEEENDDDDDDVADETANDDDDDDAIGDDDDDAHAYDSSNDVGHDWSAVHADADDDTDAIAAALELATHVVEQLQRRLLVKASEPSDERASRSSVVSVTDASARRLSTAHDSSSTGEAGVPRVRARTVSNTHCMHCSKSFNAFHRSRSCTSCGYSFCVKCVSRRQVLPSCFGFKDEAVRVCELCCVWFQRALERYFDVMALSRTPAGGSINTTNHGGPTTQATATRRASVVTSAERSPGLAPASPGPAPKRHDEETSESSSGSKLRRRQSRHSITVPSTGGGGAAAAATATQKSASRPWFSSHLRAMHVGDRLPRKSTNTDADLVDSNGTGESEQETKRPAAMARSYDASSVVYERMHRDVRAPRDASDTDSVDTQQQQLQTAPADSSESQTLDHVGVFELEPVLASVVKAVPATDHDTAGGSSSSRPGDESAGSSSGSSAPAKRLRPRTTKRSKFSRSASFDFTNLASAVSPSSTATSVSKTDVLGDDAGGDGGGDRSSDTGSTLSRRSTSSSTARRLQCFDDSDIVDARAKTDDSVGASRPSNVDLPATVLRFAVYKIGAKESQSLRRTLGFGKANPVVDRYSLELDCSQGIVRVKSVFQHRFWSFHCDAVQHLSVGSATGTAKLVVHNGVDGNQTHELQFANDDERDEFRRAVETCRSSNLHAMRRASLSSGATVAPPQQQLDAAVALGSPAPDDVATALDGATAAATSAATQGDGSPDTSASPDASSPDGLVDGVYRLQLLTGEVVMKGSEYPSTLLIGPGGDLSEPSQIWGRIRGTVAVTNFRVLFVPSERCYVPLRTALQGSAPYIPLFAITTAQVLYPSGRRSKSSRTYSTGLPSVLVVHCKDVRAMRVQLEGPPHVSDERSQALANLINKLADEAQRIRVVDRGSPDALALAPGSLPTHLSLSHTAAVAAALSTNAADTCDDAVEASGASGATDDDQHTAPSALTRRVLGPSPSPSLRPSSPLTTLPLERSGAFAFSYSVDCALSSSVLDTDGWSLYADEREFKRQIGSDLSVQPFFKYYQNARGNICKSYPSKLLLPSSMTSATLTKVTEFRAKNRLPVITYYHRRNRCVLTRSSQPLLGNLLSGSSSLSDQLLVGVYRRLPDIIRNQSIASASSRPIYIFDARKLKASTGNRLMGKGGVETPQDYPGAVVHHLNIANMYRMQSSFLSLVKLLLPGAIDDSDKTWLMRVESTRWLHHLRSVLDGAMKIARVLELEGSSVLVHCSDGWDRTSQLTALAQVMIDPYFRTIRGFAVLVEKDWCAFGHKFAERLGGDRSKDPQRSKSSPVMLQFLDAVWQIQRQFPYAFEFNERFLLHVANSLTSGLYGTFQFDSRLQRDVNAVRTTTVSVWTPVLMDPSSYTNAAYVVWDKPIWPWTGIQIMHVWEGYFLQWHPKYYNCHWVSSASSCPSALADAPLPQLKVPSEQTLGTPETGASGALSSHQRDGSFDESSGESGATVTNLPSPVPDAPRSASSSSRSSRVSSSRPQPVQAPKLPMRNVFIYRS